MLKYVPKPGVGDVNAAGCRDRDYPVAKPPDTYRIVVLGDSIAFGYCNESRGIPLPATFPKKLEAMLEREPLPEAARTEVLNFSVSGYDTAQEVELLAEKALAYEPDLVRERDLHLYRRARWSLGRAGCDLVDWIETDGDLFRSYAYLTCPAAAWAGDPPANRLSDGQPS